MASEEGATVSVQSASNKGTDAGADGANGSAQAEAARAMPSLDRLEQRAAELAKELLGPAADDAKVKVRENPLVALLVALLAGIVLGMVLGGMGRGRR